MSRLPETGPSLRRIIEQQKRQANRAGNASPFTRSGTGVTAEDEFTVDGALIVTGPMTVGGTLSLPAGIIDNDALTSPIVYRTIGDGESGMAVSATPTQSSVRTMTVPGGYTASGLVVLGSASIVNTTASTQYVFLQAYAVDTGGVARYGGAATITLAAGFAGSILAPLIRTLDGLTPGMNLTFYVTLNASAAMGAHASNWTGIEVQAAFTR